VTLIAAIALALAIALIAGLYALQDRMLFFPQPLAGAEPSSPRIEPVEIAAGDGTLLRGWFVKAERARAPLLIYFGGNAEEVSWLASPGNHPPDWSLLLVNYRGYGRSSGRPSEAWLFADALRVYDWAAARSDVDPRRIASLGRSLGSAVATYLAMSRPLVGLVLVTPLDSVTAVAQHHYPYLPVRWLLRHPFDSLSRAATIPVPVLMLVAGRDAVVPPIHAERLYERWRAPKQWIMFPDADHESIAAEPGYPRAIAAFLNDRP
jgi:fermentation-respiration switch protein FrsA (DUF1100 family)